MSGCTPGNCSNDKVQRWAKIWWSVTGSIIILLPTIVPAMNSISAPAVQAGQMPVLMLMIVVGIVVVISSVILALNTTFAHHLEALIFGAGFPGVLHALLNLSAVFGMKAGPLLPGGS